MKVEEAKLSRLRELITEGLRVQHDGESIEYINVGHALEDACARANHVIFARRGCGKILLLHDSRGKLRADIRSIYLNCEDFKQHTFPNALIEILKALFTEIDKNISGWFGKKARTKAIVKQILERLNKSRFSEIDVSDRAAKDKMRSAPVLDEATIRALLERVPDDVEQQLRTILDEEE